MILLFNIDDLPWKSEWNGSWDRVSGNPSTDSEHSSTSVLEFDKTTAIGDLDVEWIPSEVSGQSTGLESGSNSLVFCKLSVLVCELVDFDKGDSSEHLSDGFTRKGLHGLQWGHSLKVSKLDSLGDGKVFVWGDVVEGESELVEGVSDGGDHGGTSVLELGGADEGSGGFGSVLCCELVPVVLTDENRLSDEGGGAETRDLCFHLEEWNISFRHTEGGGLGSWGCWNKSSGGAD
mmetsp:Transcript_22259/g.31913  ORF Transcript_22259/g.31913 Transcript_22259/m.31913 type:complete len:234 (-) Transcript_22259:101-802(-)